MAAVRRPTCAASLSCSQLASPLFIAMMMAIFALAAVAKGAGGADPDPVRGGDGPMDCPIECASNLAGYIMETVKCYGECMARGGGGGELSAADVEKDPDPMCVVGCASKLVGHIMETVKCFFACLSGGGGGGELSAAEEKHAVMRGVCRQRVLG